jgi:hypothetical protein
MMDFSSSFCYVLLVEGMTEGLDFYGFEVSPLKKDLLL